MNFRDYSLIHNNIIIKLKSMHLIYSHYAFVLEVLCLSYLYISLMTPSWIYIFVIFTHYNNCIILSICNITLLFL